jgi:2-hydroxychromene-2-carboxylate isomerase
MGEVIRLADRRARRRSGGSPAEQPGEAVRAEFFFDLASPFTYLVAERVERAFDTVTWTPASSGTLRCAASPTAADELEVVADQAQERAGALRLPLEWPERWPAPVPAAMRVAHYAAQAGRGAGFVLAATRLAFAGGFDLDDLEILTEAAAACGLPLDACLRAAREERRDGAMEAAARRLLGAGADRLPALSVQRGVFWGEDRVADAAATARMHAAAAGPLAGA